MPYAPPTITITTTGPQTPVLSGPAPKTIMLLGTFPKGPDYPVLLSPVQMPQYFGDHTQATSAGYTGPYLAYFASQQQAPGGGPVQFLVCRAGVTRGQFVVLDAGAATCFTLQAVGVYAGSASQYLQLKLTVGSGRVTSISFSDSRTNAAVGTPLADASVGGGYDLSSNAKIVAALNVTNKLTSLGSVCVATAGASTNVPAAITTPTAFPAGTDGKGAAYNDATIGTSGSGGLLDQSLWTAADYICAGYDAAQIGATLLGHVSLAVSQNNFRKLCLGPALGTTFATLTGGSYITSGLQSSRLWCLGHDGLFAQHPATGALTAFDGFYGMAALAGLKASAPTQETLINFGLSAFAALYPAADKPMLQTADLNTLGSSGFTMLTLSPQDSTLRVRDTLSTAPQTINGTSQVNVYQYCNIQDIDDAVSTATVNALTPFKGRPMATPEETAGQMKAAVVAAINGLGAVTNGVNGEGTHFVQDPSTLNINGTVSYRSRMGIRTIPVSIGFTLT